MFGKDFFKSTFIYTIGGMLPLLGATILVFYYPKFLDTTEYARLIFYLAFAALMQLVVNVGFDGSMGTYYYDYKDDPANLKKMVSTANIFLLITGIAILLLSLIAGKVGFQLFYDDKLDFYPFGILSLITAIFNSYFKMYSNLLINQQRPERYLILNVLNFFTLVTFTVIGLHLWPHTLWGPIGGRLIAGGLLFIITFCFFYKEFGFHFDKAFLIRFLPVTTPLLIYFILVWITTYIDRNILLFFNDMGDVGTYDFAAKCVIVIDVLQSALANSITPKVFSAWKNSNINYSTIEINRYFNVYTAISILFIAGSIFLPPYILPLIIKDKNYHESFKYIPWLAVGFAFKGIYTMYLAPIFFFKKTPLLTRILVFSTVFQVVISVFLIKYQGLIGAAIAIILSRIFILFLMHKETSKFFNFSFNKFKLIWLPAIYSLVIIISEQLHFMNKDVIRIFQLLMAFTLVGIVFRKELLKVMVEKKL